MRVPLFFFAAVVASFRVERRCRDVRSGTLRRLYVEECGSRRGPERHLPEALFTQWRQRANWRTRVRAEVTLVKLNPELAALTRNSEPAKIWSVQAVIFNDNKDVILKGVVVKVTFHRPVGSTELDWTFPVNVDPGDSESVVLASLMRGKTPQSEVLSSDGGPADGRALDRRWRLKSSRTRKGAIVRYLISVACAFVLAGCHQPPDMTKVGLDAKTSLQHQFDINRNSDHLIVRKVDAVAVSPPKFDGTATIVSQGAVFTIPVAITTDGKTTIVAPDDNRLASGILSALQARISVLKGKYADFVLSGDLMNLFRHPFVEMRDRSLTDFEQFPRLTRPQGTISARAAWPTSAAIMKLPGR